MKWMLSSLFAALVVPTLASGQTMTKEADPGDRAARREAQPKALLASPMTGAVTFMNDPATSLLRRQAAEAAVDLYSMQRTIDYEGVIGGGFEQGLRQADARALAPALGGLRLGLEISQSQSDLDGAIDKEVAGKRQDLIEMEGDFRSDTVAFLAAYRIAANFGIGARFFQSSTRTKGEMSFRGSDGSMKAAPVTKTKKSYQLVVPSVVFATSDLEITGEWQRKIRETDDDDGCTCEDGYALLTAAARVSTSVKLIGGVQRNFFVEDDGEDYKETHDPFLGLLFSPVSQVTLGTTVAATSDARVDTKEYTTDVSKMAGGAAALVAEAHIGSGHVLGAKASHHEAASRGTEEDENDVEKAQRIVGKATVLGLSYAKLF